MPTKTQSIFQSRDAPYKNNNPFRNPIFSYLRAAAAPILAFLPPFPLLSASLSSSPPFFVRLMPETRALVLVGVAPLLVDASPLGKLVEEGVGAEAIGVELVDGAGVS